MESEFRKKSTFVFGLSTELGGIEKNVVGKFKVNFYN